MALCIISSATAQGTKSYPGEQEPNEVILLSSYTDGNYNVERLMVMESTPTNNDYVVHYKINMATLTPIYQNNTAEIEGLRNLIGSIESDSLKRIAHYEIIGYSSPDGPEAMNSRLAQERAAEIATLIDKECNISDYQHTVSSTALNWSDAKEAIEASNVPNKAEILEAIGSNMTQAQIEQKIKSYDAAWSYIKANILPEMRSAEIAITYNKWNIVENRTLIEEVVEPTQNDALLSGNHNVGGHKGVRDGMIRGEGITDDYIYCMLVEMPGQEIDFDDTVGRKHEKVKFTRRGEKIKF